jgi:hypothetical protein
MAAPRNWARIVTYISGVTLFLLLLQYLLGLWTNVYAPAQFSSFDSGANYSPALNGHIINGDALFLLSVIALVIAAISKQVRLFIPAVVLVVSIYVAGQFGMAYVNSTPNDAIDSFGMGTMFLVALFSAAALIMTSRRSGRTPGSTPSASTTGTRAG